MKRPPSILVINGIIKKNTVALESNKNLAIGNERSAPRIPVPKTSPKRAPIILHGNARSDPVPKAIQGPS